MKQDSASGGVAVQADCFVGPVADVGSVAVATKVARGAGLIPSASGKAKLLRSHVHLRQLRATLAVIDGLVNGH